MRVTGLHCLLPFVAFATIGFAQDASVILGIVTHPARCGGSAGRFDRYRNQHGPVQGHYIG
jgi:hypothetical protein